MHVLMVQTRFGAYAQTQKPHCQPGFSHWIGEEIFYASDRDMIAAMVWCEVGAEGMEEKKGVASVIVNRLKSSKYPNTVQAVLYQNRQFQPTWSKTSDGTTTKFLLALANGAPADCYTAADWALAGNSNVGDAIGFKLASTGIEGIVIGKVVFFS